MIQEEKELLLKDLCARLPYGVICTDSRHGNSRITEVDIVDETVYCYDFDEYSEIKHIKLHLRPMSSMTEEEKEYLQTLHNIISDENYGDGFSPTAWNAISLFNDYCHKRHLDNAGLIEKDLALPAAENMYK